MMKQILWFIISIQTWSLSICNNDITSLSYGVDISFPHHHQTVSTNYPWLPHHQDAIDEKTNSTMYDDMPIQPLGDRQSFYDNYIDSCERFFNQSKGQGSCAYSELKRLTKSLIQPISMYNYTEIGFKKMKAPEKLWQTLNAFWEKNKV